MPSAFVSVLLVGLSLVAGCMGRSDDEADLPSISPQASVAVPDTASLGEVAPADTVTRPPLPRGFSYLSDVAPEIAQEMRYATAFNFVGAPIDGYRAPVCILTTPAAEALARVDSALAARGLGLKVYDCYRPQEAVDHFVRWSQSGDETMRRAFYPEEPTATLFQRGYIARRSGHSRGSTVDLTIVRRPASATVVPVERYPTPGDGPLPRCDRPRGERFAEGDLDMGTAFDCLSTRAATAAPGFSAEVRRNRETLRSAMSRGGFVNYSKEWWHYTLREEPVPRTYQTFPVE